MKTAADLFFFLLTIMAGCRHKQSKQIPKGADAKPVSLSTSPVIVTRNGVNPAIVTIEYFLTGHNYMTKFKVNPHAFSLC